MFLGTVIRGACSWYADSTPPLHSTSLSAKVARKKGPDGTPLSMGFGFVEVDSEDVAKAVIKKLQVRQMGGREAEGGEGGGLVEVDSEDVALEGIPPEGSYTETAVAPLRLLIASPSSLQGTLLDGHKLSLQLSKAKGPAPGTKSSKKKGAEEAGTTKVVVRNVAFEATRKVRVAGSRMCVV